MLQSISISDLTLMKINRVTAAFFKQRRSGLLTTLGALLFGFCYPSFAQAQAPDDNWPSFRGTHASGNAAAQDLPDFWNGDSMHNIRWKTRIPGLAHSSPIVWDKFIYATSALSGLGDASFKHGLYGAGDAAKDRSEHKFNLYCLDKGSGKIIWEKTATTGAPIDKRHIKATYANATPVTDGRYIIAFFGSQGVFGFDMAGKLLWERSLGKLDIGAYDAPEYEWGPASSPIIYKNTVILQCDTQAESFILALNIKNGEIVWKTGRDELPSWGTPTIFPGRTRTELITNSSNFIYGYNPDSGQELWRLGGSSKITAPTPIFKDDLIIIASGRRPEKPIFAVRAGATGNITPADGESKNTWVAWRRMKRGSYMPTPVIVDKYLYVLQNQGFIDCYMLQTGEEVYRKRIAHSGGGFSASPVAADGRIYLSSEDGEIFVIKAGPGYKVIANNDIGELIMATPAISGKTLFVRARNHLFAIGKN